MVEPTHLAVAAEASLREALAAVEPGRLVRAALHRRRSEQVAALGDAIVTGPTGTTAADVQLALVGRAKARP